MTSNFTENAETILEMRNVVKKYPGTIALKGINLELQKGEVRGLLGKNGSGKSTLINVLAGLTEKTAGEIYYFGKKEEVTNIIDSESLGLRFVSQDPALMEDLTVAENIAFREKELHRNFGIVNWKEIYQEAKDKLTSFGIDLDPRAEVCHLTLSEKQMLLVLREILSLGTKIIALDEVTTSLSFGEKEKVYNLVRQQQKQKGQSFIYVSHEIDEIFRICDSVTVLKDGEVVLTDKIKNLTSSDLKRAIVGKDITEAPRIEIHEEIGKNQDVILTLKNVNNEKLSNINFELHRGEILGVYGLRGSGRTELLKTIFSLLPVDKGNIIFRGKSIENTSPSQVIQMGIGFVPEDRHEGIFFGRPVGENLSISAMEKNLGKYKLLIDPRKEAIMLNDVVREFNIIMPSANAEIDYLSGGNKQKIMLGRCFVTGVDLYLIDEGTKGIDIETKDEIYITMQNLAFQGKSIIFTSSDIDEITNISYRIMVLYEGQIMHIIPKKELTKENLLHYADGNR